ncbi:MAG: flavodoxin family protein [Candidatus Omnitrophota bacterium]
MKILAVSGSYRKGKTIDTLIDDAIAGIKKTAPEIETEKVCLIDKNIKYCTNCMICKNDDPLKPAAKCAIRDDMQELYGKILEADGYIFGTPVNCGSATAVMKTFLERSMWVFAKPGARPVNGYPIPRTETKKAAVFIISSGLVPPALRWFCDDAGKLLKDLCACGLNAKIVDNIYAGAVEKRGINYYSARARKSGEKLARELLRIRK